MTNHENPPAEAGENQPQAGSGAQRRATEEMAFDTAFQVLSELVLTPAFDKAQNDAPRTYQEVIWYAKTHPYSTRVLTMIGSWLMSVIGGRINLRRFAGARANQLTDAALGQLPAALAQFLAQRADAGIPSHRPTFLELPVLIGRLLAGLNDDEALPFAIPALPDWLRDLLRGWEAGRVESAFLLLSDDVAGRLATMLLFLRPELQEKGRRALFGGSFDVAALVEISNQSPATFAFYIDRIVPNNPVETARETARRIVSGLNLAAEIHNEVGRRLGPDREYVEMREMQRRRFSRAWIWWKLTGN